MSYAIDCSNCKVQTVAYDIVDLIDNHTNVDGKIKCTNCSQSDAFIYRESILQEKQTWKRWIKGIKVIDTKEEGYTPYIFFLSDKLDGDIDGVQFCYFKDLRKQGGRLKHGSGPGGRMCLAHSRRKSTGYS
jgi:hypothetical protein